jgi:hypothetical protein
MKINDLFKSTNFTLAIVLAIGGLWVGFPEGELRGIVEALFGIVAGAGLVREKMKSATVDWKAWIRSANTWNYIGTAVIAIVPALPIDFFQRVRDLLDSALIGNWQGVVTSIFSLATILYYVLRPKNGV